MTDSHELYSDLLLEHARKPHGRGEPQRSDGHGAGVNPLCGDRVDVWATLRGDQVEAMSFDGEGCAISTASASIMTDAMRGRTITEAHRTIESFLDAATDLNAPTDHLDVEQASLASVRRLPMRVKCVTMAWHAAEAALREAETTLRQETA